MRRNFYSVRYEHENFGDRVKAIRFYQHIRKTRLPFALAINSMLPSNKRKGMSIPYPAESLKEQLRSWRMEFKKAASGQRTYKVLQRVYNGETIEYEFFTFEDKKKAMFNIRRRIKQIREENRRIFDPVYSRKPNGLLREFQSKRLRLQKRPTDGAEYVGLEIECITPRGLDFTPLLPFSKYIEIGGDGSIDHKEGESGTEIRVCMRRDEIREVLPPLMETLKSIGARVNTSCGLHVHLDQRNNKEPEKVFQHLVRSLGLLYTVVPKSRRRNRYCKRNRHADFSEAMRGERYKAINAQAFHRYQTIEVRLFGGTLESTKIINWIEVLFAIAYGETVMRCPKTFDTALKYWKLSPENLAWLKDRQTKFAELSLTVSEHETEPNQALLDETEPDDDDQPECEDCGYRMDDCECNLEQREAA